MPNTTNFNWPTPADTDLVKDGAAAIRNLGDGVDTSLVDLKGGTTGQILSKASNADMDFAFITPNVGDLTEVQAGTGISVADGTGPIPIVTNTVATAFDAKGDLVVGTGADTFAKLTVGTDGHTLVADSAETTGLKWQAPSASALTFISRTSFSNVASQAVDGVFTSTYDNYLVIVEDMVAATAADDLQLQFRYAGPTTETGTYYGWCETFNLGGSEGGSDFSSGAIVISTSTGSATNAGNGQMLIQRVGNSSEKASITGQYAENETLSGFTIFGGAVNTARTYTGFLLKSSSTNITGVVTVYGYAKS
jgi:hypothetical protein